MQRNQPKPLPSTARVLNFILCAVSSDSQERESVITQSCPTLCDPVDCSPPGSSVHEILQARILEYGLPFSSPGALPDPGIKPRSPSLQADSLPSEPPGDSTDCPSNASKVTQMPEVECPQPSNPGKWIPLPSTPWSKFSAKARGCQFQLLLSSAAGPLSEEECESLLCTQEELRTHLYL